MNYSGNMPDWHQYNPPQSGINDVTSTAQNVNSGHLSFISSINPTQLNHSLNLNTEGHEKHQNDSTFNPRHFQPHLSGNISHGHNVADNTPLASMVQMQNCISHYGPANTRNPMVDNLNGPMDPRSTAIGGLNDELGYRNNQVPLNGPISHLNGPNVMNMNPPHGSIGARNANVNSHTSNRAGPSYVSCKLLCCNPDPNISYQQWEKYCSYQNNTTYRDNIRASGYQADARRFGNDFNFRKDNFDGKEILSSAIVPNAPNADHRRNFPDYKYRKDRLLSRSYPSNSGMLQNYPMQNYNYTGEYQKYPYNVKEYSKVNNMNMPNQAIVKHQEQSFMVQQKYNKQQQVTYQNNAMMSSSMPSTSVNPNMMASTQNTYFNPQYPRNLSTTETAHDCQEVADNVSMVNRMQMSTMHPPPHSRYQIYQQKIAMQRFSMESQLRELARIPGYQTHPKYKECLLKYKELLKLQQSAATYQGQIQQTPCVPTSTVNTSVPPINLQFDQNGVLINSNYMPEAFPRVQQVLNPQVPVDSSDKQSKQDSNNIPDMVSHSVQKPEQLVSQQPQHNVHAPTLCPGTLQKQEQQYPVQKSLEQPSVQFEVQQKTANENFNNLNSGTSNAAIQQKISKEFADKPELDVRQFLANWDESEDEDGGSSNVQNVVLSNSTPVVVVGYENVDLSAKTLKNLEGSKPEEIPSGVIAFENQDKSDANVVSAQDCLTISYSSAKNVEIAKDACKEITKESIVQPGSIIQCISNGPNEVPTIHIVDNLEIGSILQVTSGQVTETLERQETVSFFHESTEVETSAITLETDKFKKSDNGGDVSSESIITTEYNADLGNLSKEKYVESSSPPKTAESTSQTTQVSDDHQKELAILASPAKDNLDSTQSINLKKQSSFTSEESHNPDDISLPDLPTSECTPISTTLNTPIHSDSEESSERVEDLTISTNPIEVVQNSPIISFTQSPMRGEPYDHFSDEAGGAKSKSADSSESQYRAENDFNDGKSNNMLDHDNVLSTFEFPTGIDKNESAMTMKRDNKERADSSGSNASVDDERTFPLDAGTANAEMTGMCMTLTSGDYELKIMSTAMQSKPPTRNDKNSTIGRRTSESQTVVNVSNDAQKARKKLRAFSESGVKTALRYGGSAELDETLQNVATSNSASADERNNAPPRGDVDYANEARLLKATKSEDKSCATLSASKRKCISIETAHQTITTSASTIDLSLATDSTSRGSRPPAVEDSCTTKIAKSNPSASHSTKHSTTLGNDKLEKNEGRASDKSAKGDSVAERSGNKLLKVDARDSRKSQHMSRHLDRKPASSNRMDSHDKRGENIAEKCSEAIIHHNKHTQEAKARKAKSCAVENLKESNVSRNEPKTTTSNNVVDENRERLRLLKEYRRIKYKSPSVAETSNKSKDTQEISDLRASKKSHPTASPDERSQLLNDKQLCQKDANFKSAEEQERKHAILKTFVSKNINPDFAIQVTNVNLKLKDNDHQKEPQYRKEEAKNSGSLDAIKIEINVSCTERNTTEKLLHENIKNAVAETIGHLTSSISNGARSSSTNLMEIQCDKKTVCDQAVDSRNYERHDRSPAALTESPYDDHIRKPDQENAKALKYKSPIATCKEGTTNDDTSGSSAPKKRKSLSSEREVINNAYEAKSNVNVEAEPAPNILETPKSEHVLIRRRSVHQDAERNVAATNFPVNTEESKISTDNTSHTGSMLRNSNTQKKEYQETTAAFLCKNARSLQDSVVSRLNAGASTSSSTVNPDLESVDYDNNSTYFDYNHFDVAPNENADADDKRMDKWKRLRRDDSSRFNSLDLYETASGYMNPIFFSANELENLNTVPVYTTKDGKITYSPNPRFTYHELLMEARAKEGYTGNTRDPYFARSPSFDYYNCSKLRKVFKRSREVVAALRKREDLVDAKQQFATKHVDYLPSKNVHHAKARNSLHLEFFNDGADKLYTSRSDQQENKEDSTKNIVDVNLLEKQCNPDGEPASNIKHCRVKALVENLDYEKGYNESSVFDPNIFLEPRAQLCWEETMESVKSYSSHIDRRNSGNLKEFNFSEIFVKQKRPDTSFPFPHAEQGSLDESGTHKASNNRDTTNEPSTLPRTACSEDLRLVRDDDSRCEQINIVAPNEQKDTNDNQNDVLSTEVNDKQQVNKLPSTEHETFLHGEHTKRQDSQFDEETAAIASAGEAPSCVPDVVDNEVHVLEAEQCPTSHVQETFAESLAADDSLVPLDENRLSAEDAAVKEVSDKDSAEVTSPSKSNADCDNLPDEPKCTETVEELPVLAADEPAEEINDSAKNNSDSTANDKICVYQEVSKPAPADREDEKEKSQDVPPATESNVATEIYFNDETSERNDSRDKENSTVCEKEEAIALRNPPDLVAAVSQPLNEKGDEQKSQKLQDDEHLAENSSKDPGIDEVDCCGSTSVVLFEPTATLELDSVRPEENVCDIFASETHEQNISEFTVIKSIIKSDKKQCEELNTRETAKDNDSIIDSKFLCMDSSDCGIYPEDRCPLMQISEHDFTEDDSMVPMEWETSQIQQDAVNRLCGIDESSIDFAAAANSLRSEDNSLLDNLSLSRSMMEPRLLELQPEIESKSNKPAVLAERTASPSPSPPVLEKFKATSCDDENKEQKEQNPVSSSSYDKVAYLRATDCNANTKMVPKLVIKKTEASSKFVTKMSPSSSTDSVANKSVSRSSCQPKIPKMIIRNARSRPGTPSIEAVPDEASVQVSISERALIMIHETREDPYENDSESSLQGPGSYKNKIPKMKIKLDEKHANKIVKAEDNAEFCMKRKNMKKTIPKVKIKNSPRSDPSDNSVYNSATPQELRNLERNEEKIPILKLRKQERNRSSSPEVIRKRQSSSHSDVPTKKYKKSERDNIVGHSTRRSNSDSARTTVAQGKLKRNSIVGISEKIPKVIIKRTSASAEFKCELSKSGKNVIAKSAKWQPEVKLERYRILDSMAKDLKSSSSLTPVSLRIIDKIFSGRRNNCRRRKHGHNLHRLSRSNSTSDLLPVKCKQRRMSDYDCKKTSGTLRDDLSLASSRDADSKNTKTCTTPKKSASTRDHVKLIDNCHKNDKRRSRSRDNNSRTETNIGKSKKDQSAVRRSSSEKVICQRDECKIDIKQEKVIKMKNDTSSSINLDQKDPPKYSSSTNFKTALKELKTMSKVENCFVKVPGSSGILSEVVEAREDKEQSKENDSVLCRDDDKIAIKERLCSEDMDIECTLQDDVVSFKEEPILSNFVIDNNAVIKIESSDESQTTIEILPASPGDSRCELENHIIDDGDSEQLYPADAIPTQFELELEITDNSNIDLLDVSMPKLNPVVYYGSSRTSVEEYYDPTSKAGRYGKPEPSHCDKNSLERDKSVEIDISSDDRPSESVKSIDCVEEIPPKFLPCSKRTDSQSKEKFCCNDSLIKEVLAAKETLKKCLSKSRCESSAHPKTTAEKKQGSCFDLNSLSETHPKSSDVPESCDATLQTGSIPAASKHNKTESIAEKSDKKHSKPSKSVFVKKKVKSPDRRDEELRPTLICTDSKETTENECTTISLKTFKRFSQTAASHENPPRVVNLSEKRKKNPGDQRDTVPQSPRDAARKEESKMSSYKIPKISKSVDQGSNASGNAKGTQLKENNMPILEPAVAVNFDGGSDRDSSRSPPVITNQDTTDVNATVPKLLDNDKVITSDNKVDSNMKDIHKKSEMSIADFVSQLVYHEKATIKHRRYCNLCERWFPTTSRHRRHLAGYQHRHTELTQRRSIHTLFMLFTGKPCPRLMPANVMRNDCSVGELTPLQIAVQDVTKSFDHIEQSPKKENDVDK